MSDATEIASQYLLAGNAVTAFYVTQTIIFLNSIHTSPILLSTLRKKKSVAVTSTFGIALIYLFAVVACGYFEYNLRDIGVTPDDKTQQKILILCLLAIYGRLGLVVALACACAAAICALQPESSSAQAE